MYHAIICCGSVQLCTLIKADSIAIDTKKQKEKQKTKHRYLKSDQNKRSSSEISIQMELVGCQTVRVL